VLGTDALRLAVHLCQLGVYLLDMLFLLGQQLLQIRNRGVLV
jgi:hypothetical protein